MNRLHGCLLATALATALAGCGAAPPAPQAPAAPGVSSMSPDAAGDDLDRAERDLEQALTAGGQNEKPDQPTAPKGAADASQLATDGCALACRALASMERAADHLCGLAGDGDERCTGARGRVERARERVAGSCPTCAAP